MGRHRLFVSHPTASTHLFVAASLARPAACPVVPDTVSITAPRRGTTSGAGRRHPAQSSDGGCLRLHIRSSIGQHLSESARTGTNDDSLVVEAIDFPDGDPDWTVRGLRLPEPLVHLLAAGRWRDPDERALRRALPWFEDPLIFLSSVRWMRRESESLDRELTTDRRPGCFGYGVVAANFIPSSCRGSTSSKPFLSRSTAILATMSQWHWITALPRPIPESWPAISGPTPRDAPGGRCRRPSPSLPLSSNFSSSAISTFGAERANRPLPRDN